jgi:asparagine synthase (glutamine-hydrolysing)
VNRQILLCHEPGAELILRYSGPPPRGEILCLMDGHLDNAADLAAELGTGTDLAPEALLRSAYLRWGPELPARLRGDFLLILWECHRRVGLVARDQLGVRPAYLHRSGSVVRVANDLPVLLADLPRRPDPDPAGVAHWIAASARPGPSTLYRGIERLPPGGMLVLDRGGARASRYWRPRFREPLSLPALELKEMVGERLRAGVGRRLAKGAGSAVLLSGGLDSAAVAAMAGGLGEGEVLACSATFPDHPQADESELIAELRSHFGIDGPSAEVRAEGLLDSAVEHLAACGLPLLSWGDFWTLPLLRRAAQEGASVVLGGDGGDELFGPRQNAIAEAIRSGRPREALRVARCLPGAGPSVPRREVVAMFASQALIALPRSAHRALVARREARHLPGYLRAPTRRALLESDEPTRWRGLDGPLWWAELADALADRLDEAGVFEHQRRRGAMAGLEARHPMLDLDLVELCLRLAPRSTLDRRYTRPILREVLAGLVPDAVRLRPQKARFESVVAASLTGPDVVALRSLLLDPAAELRAYVDQAEMERQLFEGQGGPELGGFHWMWLTWRLATAELWLRAERDPTAPSTTFFNLTSGPRTPKINLT